MSTNLEQKMWMYIKTFYVCTQNFAKIYILCGLCKNDKNNVSWKIISEHRNYLFYTCQKYMLPTNFCVWTYNVRIYTRNFCFKFMNILKYNFWVVCASTPMNQNIFPRSMYLLSRHIITTPYMRFHTECDAPYHP